ncbi:MAG: SPOR domain-containing protein [Spirochaetes bacterium]|nr:SPOR domain-containing protein [Spirochaetota bacterium]
MENFEQFDEQKVKEKNIYLLHLDKARIAILSSIIIGIIAIAFLIGMKLTAKDKVERDLFTTNNINSGTLTSPSDINDLFESKPVDNPISALGDEKTEITPEKMEIPVTKSETDVLTADNINVVPAASSNTDTITVKSVSPKSSPKKQVNAVAVNPKKSNSNTAAVKASVKNDKVKNVAVSSNISNNKAVTAASFQKKTTGGFSLQVASYDNYSRAKLECDTLKKQNFETYIDDAFVNGINYYRVRIGPFSEKYEAVSVLDRLQSDSKYAESYIVKE